MPATAATSHSGNNNHNNNTVTRRHALPDQNPDDRMHSPSSSQTPLRDGGGSSSLMDNEGSGIEGGAVGGGIGVVSASGTGGESGIYDQALLEEYIDEQLRHMQHHHQQQQGDVSQHEKDVHGNVVNVANASIVMQGTSRDAIAAAAAAVGTNTSATNEGGPIANTAATGGATVMGGAERAKQRLHMWFEAIEQEFDSLLEENMELRSRLERYEGPSSAMPDRLSSTLPSASVVHLEKEHDVPPIQVLSPAQRYAINSEGVDGSDTAESLPAGCDVDTTCDNAPAASSSSAAAAAEDTRNTNPSAVTAAAGTSATSTASNPSVSSTSVQRTVRSVSNARKLSTLQHALFSGSNVTPNKTKIAERVRLFSSKFKIAKGGSSTERHNNMFVSSTSMPAESGYLSSDFLQQQGTVSSIAPHPQPLSMNTSSQIKRRYHYHPDVIFDVQCAALDLGLADMSRREPYYIFSASVDKTVAVWSQSLANPICIYTGHRGAVNAVRVNEETGMICSASGDKTCHLWRVNDLYDDDVSTNMSKLVSSASFSHPSDEMMSEDELGADSGDSGDDHSMDSDLYETSMAASGLLPLNQPVISSHRMRILDSHASVVSCCDWMTREHVVTASWDGKIRVFNVETGGTPIEVMMDNDGDAINRVASSHQSETVIASASMGNTLKMWDTRQPERLTHVLKGHSEQVSAIAFAWNDRFLFSASEDGMLKFWDLRKLGTSTHAMKTINCHSGINDISISNYHSRIAVATNKRRVRIFDIAGHNIENLQKYGHRQMVTSVAWSPDGNHVYSSGTDRTVIQWNTST